MKKSLLLMALLGSMAAASLHAEEIWWKGVTHNPDTQMMEGAITTYKLLSPSYYTDSNMCWVASACNLIAWWQDRVEENGALIIPESAPRDYDVFLKERQLWNNVGGYQGVAIQEWMTGGSKLVLGTKPGYEAKQEALDFAGYYPRLAGACLGEYNYSNSRGVNPDTLREYPDYSQYEYTLIQTYWFRHSNHDLDDPEKTQYQWASEKIVEFMENDWGVCWATNAHAMTVYGVEVDEDGLVTKIFNSDNNDYYTPKGKYTVLTVNEIKDGENKGCMDTSWRSGNESTYVANICALRTTGIRFLDYDVRIGDNLVEEDEAVFSHYCNLIVDGAEDFKLQYDLRDAAADGSPVDAKKVEQYTLDEGLSFEERYYDEEVPTGDMRLRGGQVTLVNCKEGREKLDGGGSVEGTIVFEDSRVKGTDAIQEANRTLKVDRTDTIAKEINLAATKGTNTLEVTESHTATFGTLSGTGTLDKTGKGDAVLTDALTLNGQICVYDGRFILEKGAELAGTSGMTVHDGGVLKGSGKFTSVTVDGGTLIVGNSPGQQKYLGDLTVTAGEIVFSVDGWETPANEEQVGWGSGTYSNIVMDGGALTLGEGASIRFDLAGNALSAMFDNSSEGFTMTLATGFGNKNYFSSDLLDRLASQTFFFITDENGASVANSAGLNAGASLNSHITNLEYKLLDDTTLCVTGVFMRETPPVPEPATGTLGLLALAGLAARRKR